MLIAGWRESRVMRPFRIGIVADCLHLPVQEAVARAAELGAEGVQVYTVRGPMSPRQLDARARAAFAALCRRCGVAISALCGDMGGGFRDAADNPSKVRRTKAILDLAADLGSPVVTTHVGVIPAEPAEPAYGAIRAACAELAEHARARGVALAVETGPETASTLKRLLDDIDSPNLGVNLDPANLVMVVGDDPVAAVRLLAGRIVHTHAKDGRRVAPCDPLEIYHGGLPPEQWPRYFQELPLGQGEVDWPAYLDELERAGYKGFLTIEREVGDNPAADIAEAARFLQAQIGRT